METTKKILIVDDDIDVITVMESILTKKGYNVISALNKDDGMIKVKEEKPDLAILDVMMTTHYEGFEMAKELVGSKEFNNMSILMQTSIDVLTTNSPSVQAMAREFRENPEYKELQVLLVKNMETGSAGVDYLTEDGKTVWFPVDGFLRKPVNANKLVPEIERLIAN